MLSFFYLCKIILLCYNILIIQSSPQFGYAHCRQFGGLLSTSLRLALAGGFKIFLYSHNIPMPKRKDNFNANFLGERPSDFVVDLKSQLEEMEELQGGKKRRRGFGVESFYEKFEELNFKEHFTRSKEKLAGKIKEPVNKLKKLNIKFNVRGHLKNGKEKAVKIKEKTKQPVIKLKQARVDKKKVKQAVLKIAKNSQPIIVDEGDKSSEKSRSRRSRSIAASRPSRDLAVFAVFRGLLFILRPIGKLIYKISYRIGWLIIFLARFIYFSGLAIISPIAKYGAILFAPARNIISRRKRIPSARADKQTPRQGMAARARILARFTYTSFLSRRRETKTSRPLKSNALIAETSRPLRSAMSFAVVLFLLVLPFKAFTYYKAFSGFDDLRGNVLGASEEAVNNLLSAGQFANEMDFKEAQENFSQAANQFLEAQNELGGINNILLNLASVAPNKDLRLASESKDILSAGERAAELGKHLSLAVNSLLGDKEEGRSIGEALDDFIEYGELAVMDAGDLSILLDEIDLKNIPVEFQDKFVLSRKTAEFLRGGLEEFVGLARAAQVFLGAGDYKRYLFVFQNNAEMRATGGFIGSYALVDFSNGKIKNIEIPAGGSYDTEGGLKERIIAPEPLHLVNPLWHFWDANWWPDWPTSARKLAWFYERSGGPTVDGVIGLTPTVLERILEVIGPVDMTEEYGVVVTAENFWETTREVIENYNESSIACPAERSSCGDKEGLEDLKGGEDDYQSNSKISSSTPIQKPKKIIGDLAEKIIKELPARLNRDVLIKLIKAIEVNLNEKHILFYFNDTDLQNKIEDYGWDGKIRHTTRDYLSVINTNIAGGKSDRKIKENINVETRVQDDGSIVNTVKIRRTHFGSKYENFSGVRNVNWMRIYVPLGSKLIEASGFTRPNDIYFDTPGDNWQEDMDVSRWEGDARIDEASGTKIYEESGKTVFANWSMVDPGETITVYLKYKLPFRFQEKEPYTVMEKINESLNPAQKDLYSYSLLVQKQAGSYNSRINSSLILPDDMNIVWYFSEELNGGENGWRINEPLDTDKYWAAIITK